MNQPINSVNFSLILNNLNKNSFHIENSLITPPYVNLLAQDLAKHNLSNSRISNQKIARQDIRNDQIHWINESDPIFSPLFDFIHSLKTQLNQFFYLNLKKHEFHYARYSPGHFYKKHLDSFCNNNHRKITIIFYLNSQWEPSHAGELKLYLKNQEMLVPPIGGTCVIFLSEEIPHEVLPSNTERLSLTGWLSN